jgi:hypothetical protein
MRLNCPGGSLDFLNLSSRMQKAKSAIRWIDTETVEAGARIIGF